MLKCLRKGEEDGVHQVEQRWIRDRRAQTRRSRADTRTCHPSLSSLRACHLTHLLACLRRVGRGRSAVWLRGGEVRSRVQVRGGEVRRGEAS